MTEEDPGRTRDHDDRLPAIFRHVDDIVLLFDMDARVLDANPSACETLGVALGELRGLHPWDFDPDYGEERVRGIVRTVQSHGSATIESHVHGPAGDRHPLEIKLNLIPDGPRPRMIAVARNFAERRKAQQELQRIERQHRTVLENALDYIVVFDRQGKIEYVNRLGPGFEAETPVGASVFEYLDPRSVPACKEAIEAVFDGESVEVKITDRDSRFYRCRYTPLFSEKRIRAVVSFSTDITGQKYTEQSLRESEQRYRTLLAQAPGALVTLDPETTLPIYFNDQVLEILGCTREEFVRTPVAEYDVVEAPRNVEQHVERVLKDGRDHFETAWRTRRGEIRHMLVDSRTVDLAGRVVLHSFALDITERKRAEHLRIRHEERLRRMAYELSLAEERERRRIATEVHDRVIQNLATARMKVAEIARSDDGTSIEPELSALQRLVDETIAESRSLLVELSPPVLYELGFLAGIEWLADRMRQRSEIACRLEDDGRDKPLADDVEIVLFQSVRELLNNVARHARARSVEIGLRRRNGQIRIDVADDGTGFSPEHKALDGTSGGFGLFNIRERLQHLGGEMKIDTGQGKGTRITLIAPLRPEEPAGSL